MRPIDPKRNALRRTHCARVLSGRRGASGRRPRPALKRASWFSSARRRSQVPRLVERGGLPPCARPVDHARVSQFPQKATSVPRARATSCRRGSSRPRSPRADPPATWFPRWPSTARTTSSSRLTTAPAPIIGRPPPADSGDACSVAVHYSGRDEPSPRSGRRRPPSGSCRLPEPGLARQCA